MTVFLGRDADPSASCSFGSQASSEAIHPARASARFTYLVTGRPRTAIGGTAQATAVERVAQPRPRRVPARCRPGRGSARPRFAARCPNSARAGLARHVGPPDDTAASRSAASGRIAGAPGSTAVVCAGDVSAPVVAGAAKSSPPVRTTWTIAATAIPATRRNNASSQRGRLTFLAGADSRPSGAARRRLTSLAAGMPRGAYLLVLSFAPPRLPPCQRRPETSWALEQVLLARGRSFELLVLPQAPLRGGDEPSRARTRVRGFQRSCAVLLDEEGRRALLAHLADDVEDQLDDQQREPERRLIEDEPSDGSSAPGHREHLLLPPRRPRDGSAAPRASEPKVVLEVLGEPSDRGGNAPISRFSRTVRFGKCHGLRAPARSRSTRSRAKLGRDVLTLKPTAPAGG